MDEETRRAIKELDLETLAAQGMAVGSMWPMLTLTCLLIDKGVITKDEFLTMADALDDFAAIDGVLDMPESDDVLLSLRKVKEFVEVHDLPPGKIRDYLQVHSAAASLIELRRVKRQQRDGE
nr:hypothetical protein [uncultured Cohaesibacter sp.]